MNGPKGMEVLKGAIDKANIGDREKMEGIR